jgi:hypothetical protein
MDCSKSPVHFGRKDSQRNRMTKSFGYFSHPYSRWTGVWKKTFRTTGAPASPDQSATRPSLSFTFPLTMSNSSGPIGPWPRRPVGNLGSDEPDRAKAPSVSSEAGVLPPSQPRVNRLFRPGPSSFPGSFRKRRTGQKPVQFNTMDKTQRPSRGPRQPNRQKRPRRREGGFYRPNPSRSTQEFDPPQTFFAPPKTPGKKHRLDTIEPDWRHRMDQRPKSFHPLC